MFHAEIEATSRCNTRCAHSTLFIDWRGRAHICDHDLHGEYELGDLMAEPLALILERRQKLLDDGCPLEICRQCNDVMKMGGTFPLASRRGGIFRDWLYYLHQDMADPLGGGLAGAALDLSHLCPGGKAGSDDEPPAGN